MKLPLPRPFLLFALLLGLAFPAIAHDHATLQGVVRDSVFGEAIGYATVMLNQGETGSTTDAFGNFKFTKLPAGPYVVTVSALGFSAQKATVFLAAGRTETLNFNLQGGTLQLSEVTISQPSADRNQTMQQINQVDKALRPINSAQDLLRLVPGLVIAQHAGGGKAEQIFMRGFDVDHGTDFAVSIDGMPVNMVSHAHGQGYADFHFVIPETVEGLQVYKGPYSAKFGNFATAGAGAFRTKNSLRQNQVKLEAGRFDTYRGVALLDLLGNRHLLNQNGNENAYVAAEYVFSNAYFEAPQHLKRLNVFTKYTGFISDRSSLSLSASTFRSAWNASGQIPERVVKSGEISRFGSLDNTEGGSTDRSNINAVLTTALPNEALFTNQFFFSNYHFDLYSNFTFFLNDPVNGDGIRQTESGRNLYGYAGSLEKRYVLGGKNLNAQFSAGLRLDDAGLGLMHAAKRQVLDTIVAGRVWEQNYYAYTDQTLELTDRFSVNAGLRFDQFFFRFKDQLNPELSGQAAKYRVSPKLSLFYKLSDEIQVFARSGLGFHSNDARAIVANRAANVLPKALGYELGSTLKLAPGLLLNAAVWGLDLESELIYVGDEGVVEMSGPTRRLGTDLAIRYQLSKLLFADADLNVNHGRMRGLPSGENYIPLAPSLTSIGGLSLKQERGFNCSLRYRYLNSRPANETNSVVAKGYFLLDAVVNYHWAKVQLGISAENLLNSEWNEAQFDTESRLRNETAPVSELHFTPGTPFFIKTSLTYSF